MILTVNPLTSRHCVYGTVTDPPNQANLVVYLVNVIQESYDKFNFEYIHGDFTDTTGAYRIFVPDEYANKWWHIIAIDFANVEDHTSNDLFSDSVFIVDSVNKDLTMNPTVPPDTTVIYGVWKDEVGNPVAERAKIIGFAYLPSHSPMRRWIQGETDTTGAVYGNTYTKTYSDGYYMMCVSDAAPQYTIKVSPMGYESVPSIRYVAPRDTDVNFNLVFVGVEENVGVYCNTPLQVYPNYRKVCNRA